MSFNSREQGMSLEKEGALSAFSPAKFCFEQYKSGWQKELPDVGMTVIAPVSWEHFQLPTSSLLGLPTNSLHLIEEMQQNIFGFKDMVDAVPTNVLAIAHDTGGEAFVAYQKDKGFTRDGWLGFSVGFGGRDGVLVSHMLGVRKDARGTEKDKANVGWHMKMIQAYEAIKTGHTSMQWTYDQLRSVNARLNIEKLGGLVDTYTLNKYGFVQSKQTGESPTDRFTVEMDLFSPRVQQRVKNLHAGVYKPLAVADVADIPVVTPETVRDAKNDGVQKVLYEIPGDVDEISPEEQERWKMDARAVLGELLTTENVVPFVSTVPDPAVTERTEKIGLYRVSGFATTEFSKGNRKSFYVLQRK